MSKNEYPDTLEIRLEHGPTVCAYTTPDGRWRIRYLVQNEKESGYIEDPAELDMVGSGSPNDRQIFREGETFFPKELAHLSFATIDELIVNVCRVLKPPNDDVLD